MSVGELIVSIIGDMKALSKAFDEINKEIGGVATTFQTQGAKMSSAGSAMTKSITVPIAAIVGSSALLVNWASDVEQSQGRVRASLGLTAEEAKHLEEVSISVWKNGYGESLDEVNDTLISIRHNMAGLADEELESVTSGALVVAQVYEQDVNNVTATAGVLMKNFGISGTKALDIITVGFQKGGDFSGELLDTLRENAPQFKSIGMSSEEFLSTLIAGAQSGAWNLDKVGDAVKEFNIRAQDGSKTTAEGFAAIGLDAEEMGLKIAQGGDTAKEAYIATVAGLMAMDDPMERNIAGVALFGTQWEDVRSQVIEAGAAQIGSIADVSGAMEAARKEMDDSNPMLALTEATRELQAAMLPIVQNQLIPILTEDLFPILTDTIVPFLRDTAIPIISDILQLFGDLPQPMQLFILFLLGLVAALGPALLLAGAFATSLGSVAALFASGGLFAGAGGVIAGALSAIIPLLPILALLAAAVAAVYLAFTHWDEIKEIAARVWETIQEILLNAYYYLVDYGGLIPLIVSDAFDQIMEYLEGIDLSDAGTRIMETLTSAITSGAIFPPVIMFNMLDELTQELTGYSLFDAGRILMSTFVAGIKAKIQDAYNTVKAGLTKINRLLPHSPAKEGPFKELPNWDALFVDPVQQSLGNMNSTALGGLQTVAGTLQSASSSTTNNYAGDEFTIQNVNLSADYPFEKFARDMEQYNRQKRIRKGIPS